jgi:hypothetical protein
MWMGKSINQMGVYLNMKYSEYTCYWCGRQLERTKHGSYKAVYSLATDTIRTQRNFCCIEHLKAFTKTATGKKGSLKLKPYYGKQFQLTADQIDAIEQYNAEIEALKREPNNYYQK